MLEKFIRRNPKNPVLLTVPHAGNFYPNIFIQYLRLKLNNYSIIKIADAKVDHLGWSSHFAEIKDTMNVSRIWHFTWSSLYFENKFCKKSIVLKKLFKIIFYSTLKLILNLIIFRFDKVNQNVTKLSACLAFILNRGSYFRIKHKV